MNQGPRKLMTIRKALRPRNDMDCICQEKKDEEDPSTPKLASIYR